MLAFQLRPGAISSGTASAVITPEQRGLSRIVHGPMNMQMSGVEQDSLSNAKAAAWAGVLLAVVAIFYMTLHVRD